MDKQETNINQENIYFNDIVQQCNRGNITKAAEICKEACFGVIDLIKMDEDARDCDVYFYDEDSDQYDILNPFKNPNHIALIIDKLNKLETP